MTNLYEQFSCILKEFGEKMRHPLAFDEALDCAFLVDGYYAFSIHYLPESDGIILWTLLGDLPDDELAEKRAEYLLRIQDLELHTRGFSIGMEEQERRIVAHDIRNAEEIYDVDHLSAWINDLLEVTKNIRKTMAEEFPYDADYDIADLMDTPTDGTHDLPQITFLDENGNGEVK